MTALLEIESLTRRYAGLVALDQVSFLIETGGIHGVIGPNGAGKTTLFDLISGLVVPSEGRIRLAGQEIQHLPPFRRATMGLARTFQNIRLFSEMTVLENVLAGMHTRLETKLSAILLRPGRNWQAEREAAESARRLLDFVGIGKASDRLAGELSYGDRRRVEIARALASEPKLLLLDEPAAGLNPAETAELAALLRQLPSRGVTLLLVEHDMRFVMGLCEQLTVLDFGRVIARGTPDQVRRDPEVIRAYLGTAA